MLRNLTVRLILWLSARYGIVLLDEQRRNASPDAVERAMRWEAFFLERGGIGDMIAAARMEAFEAFAECRPDDIANKTDLANSDRCWRQIEQRIRSVIESGKIEASQREMLLKADSGNPRKSISSRP